MKIGLQPPYEDPYKIVNRTETVFRILMHGKEFSVSVDRLKHTYVPKELVDIPAVVRRKEKVLSELNEVLDTGEKNSAGSSSRQKNHFSFQQQNKVQPQVYIKSLLSLVVVGLPVDIVVCCIRRRIQEKRE
ncbi:hypothetical protein NPIL_514261 [Nephila pilipes]|uniref:Uncharacterized protein n=1 Tax=Nephila pilipes TaxID=299642 RepID=A0A8X6QSR4_NEPPI|nr:hypothetical protein NPIL_514261 [Nephila pilipes]